MNLFVFRTRDGSTRQFRVSPRDLAIGAAVSFVLVFMIGFTTARMFGQPSEAEVFAELRAALEAQQAEVEFIREDSTRTVDALAARIGQLSAHIIRLDALGQRLVNMAGLEDGEFNFGAEPPMGGPENSDAAFGMHSGEIGGLVDDLQGQIEDRMRQLDVLESLMFNRRLTAEVRPEGRPVSTGYMSSGFGYRTDPFHGRRAFHGGLDFVAPKGSEVLAIASGVVIFSGRDGNYGNMVELDHGNGLVTRYAHNKENLVTVGDVVKKGDLIALVGSTGRSTAPHVHLEVLENGRLVNPRKYVN